MPVDLSAALIKITTPIISALAAEGIKILKDYNTKRDAENSIGKISKAIININTVKTMWARTEGVLIEEFYHPPKIFKKPNKSPIESLDELTTNGVLLEGIVGQGKSILLRHLCWNILEQGKIPAFVELRMISKERNIRDLILNFLESSGINGTPEVLEHLMNKGMIALVLDGFDEIPSELVREATYEIDQIQRKYSELNIIISSRPLHSAHNLASFKIYSLAELEETDYEQFLRKIIPDPVRRFEITEAISNTPDNIKGIIKTPLMLTLLILVYQNESEIPSELPDFFDKLFNTVFTKHDKLKPGFERKHNTSLSESKIQRLFDAFCFMHMQNNGNRTLTKPQFDSAFAKGIKYTHDTKCELEEFRKDIVNVACLMLEDGFDQITFLHKSILEYHAASFIKSSNDEFAKKFYSLAPQHFYRWAPCMSFLCSIDTFRYGSLYILEEYPIELKEINKALEEKTNQALIEYIRNKLGVKDIQIEGHTLLGMASDNRRLSTHTTKLQYQTYLLLSEQIKYADPKTIQKAIRESPASERESGLLSINVRSMVNNLDMDKMWLHLDKAKSEIEQEIEKYKKIVDIELQKIDIFD